MGTKMKRKIRQLISILIFTVLLTAGCGKTPAEIGNSEEPAAAVSSTDMSGSSGERAMGRYVEKPRDLSDMLFRADGIVQMQDGRIVIQDYYNGQIVSGDNGATWELTAQPWLEEWNGKAYIHELELSNDGYVAIMYTQTELISQQEADEEDSEEVGTVWQYALISPEGNMIPIDLKVEIGRQAFFFSDQGELFVVSRNQIYLIDKESGKAALYLETEEAPRYLSIQGSSMVIVGESGFFFYDREEQKWIEDQVINDFIKSNYGGFEDYDMSAYTLLPFQEEGRILYIAFKNGLYRHVIGGSSIEQVIDGSLNTFSNPSTGLVGMIKLSGNEFLTLYTGGTAMRYVYDADMPTVPDQQMVVYSLEHNDVLQQAITLYQARNQDIYVKYVVGLDNSSSVTREDALKKLNTEIMAGTGPDLLVLDNMPISSYLEKGMLADITPYIQALEEQEGLLPVIKDTYRKDGGTYAVPATFTVPLLVGEKGDLDRIQDLQTLADTVEAYRRENSQGSILGLYNETQVLKALALMSAVSWQDSAGKVNEKAITEFLSQAKRIYQAEVAGLSPEILTAMEQSYFYGERSHEVEEAYLNAGTQSPNFTVGDIKLLIGHVDDGFSLSTLTSALETADVEGTFKGLKGAEGLTYIPRTVVGISAASPRPEMAGELLQILLGQENMDLTYGAYPINQASFDRCFINQYSNAREIGAMSTSSASGTEVTLYINWPEEKWLEQFRSILLSAKIPVLTDSRLKETILAEGVSALNGTKSVADTTAAIMKKLAIYMAE